MSLAALLYACANPSAATPSPTPVVAGSGIHKIQHVVVIMQENRSFDAYVKFIEDGFLGGQRLDPKTDGRPDPRPTVRETVPALGDITQAFDFSQRARPPVLLDPHPMPELPSPP